VVRSLLINRFGVIDTYVGSFKLKKYVGSW
jgi:hypothetical protein